MLVQRRRADERAPAEYAPLDTRARFRAIAQKCLDDTPEATRKVTSGQSPRSDKKRSLQGNIPEATRNVTSGQSPRSDKKSHFSAIAQKRQESPLLDDLPKVTRKPTFGRSPKSDTSGGDLPEVRLPEACRFWTMVGAVHPDR